MSGDKSARSDASKVDLAIALGIVVHRVDDDPAGKGLGWERLVLAEGDGDEDHLAEAGGRPPTSPCP